MKFDHFLNKLYPLVFSSALPDLEMAHKYADEFYTVHCPEAVYKEVDRDSSQPHEQLSNLWGEQLGGLKIGRQFQIRTFPEITTEEQQKHTKRGTEITRDVRFNFGILELKRRDLYPEMGDLIEYGGYMYELIRVYVKPESLWMHTGQPLHVAADGVIYRPGDVKHAPGESKI